ncbi:MAG: prolyl oligopeptidase family serine peptidase [Caldilineaceae bacterium]
MSEYGSPELAGREEGFDRYSPLHNLRLCGNYPATLITTHQHDPRVGEAHSLRFAQALQHACQ